MTRILVTTDQSELGQQAFAHAQALAGALGAELVALCVQPDPNVAVAGEFGYLPPTDPKEYASQALAVRDALTAQLPEARVLVEQAGGRPVSRAIIDTAQAEGADLIVMATHGRSGLGRAILGSVAEAVVHHSKVPVVLVRSGQKVTAWR
ncbi:Nucleotide-binding universal stress protein, UspA family [Deinococcus reticulitermitis]|uniref:Nucleotide-binding universal stress protein, UspA family n=1 Tax=Deinococcus reticulitermitis TaxID=856736 RepID=A0A1H6WFD5_9DEIO|nr:universal stress protein [Deinococcus reticulitermitis]SEJ11530.1 Nucleotide-binding universal stress protein, UspA family [Deinococcus reticulitermitis]